MTLEECFQEYERTGKIDGFEGWTDCMNYPEYGDLEFGHTFDDIVVEGGSPSEYPSGRYIAESRLNFVFYIMIGFIAIILIVLLGIRRR